MEEITKLLRIVEALDEATRNAGEQAPSDSDLTEARAALVVELRNAADTAGGTQPDIVAARAIRTAIDRIDSELVTRTEALAAAQAEAATLLEGLDPEVVEPVVEPAAEIVAEPEIVEEPALVAASLSDAITRSSKRAAQRPVIIVKERSVAARGVGPAQDFPLTADANLSDAAVLFDKYGCLSTGGAQALLHIERQFPENRVLGRSPVDNSRMIDEAMGMRAITAAGGICDPLPADFTHPICGDRGRPIRDAVPNFSDPSRGGARFIPSAGIADVVDGITVWTSTTDATPGSSVKACPRVECEEEDSAKVDAIVACLTIGNFQARFNPELWKSRLDLLMVAHDRIAEQAIYNDMKTGSTSVTYAGGDGTVVDVLTAIDKASAGLRSRHRLNKGTTLRAVLPAWLQDALRANLTGQTPAGSTDLFAVADATLNTFFTTRNVTPVWSNDIEVFGAQSAGTLLNFPGGDVDVLLYPEGTWMFVDGGTMDLGTSIQDSGLNPTNDRQAFMETFEKVVFRGCESLLIDVPVSELCICTGTSVS